MKHIFEYLEFNELSDKAKKNAIDKVREQKFDGKWTSDMEWVIDDDSLFEPSDSEMTSLFGADYYENNGDQFMIQNTRKDISLVGKQDQNHHIHCARAIDVTNNNLFLRWLGIPNKFKNFVYYGFEDPGRSTNTRITLEIDDEDTLIEKYGENAPMELEEYFINASKKFDKHIDQVLTNISNQYDEQFEDSGVIETIEVEDLKFDEDGDLWNEDEE